MPGSKWRSRCWWAFQYPLMSRGAARSCHSRVSPHCSTDLRNRESSFGQLISENSLVDRLQKVPSVRAFPLLPGKTARYKRSMPLRVPVNTTGSLPSTR